MTDDRLLYDTKEGIASRLTSLDGLHWLISARHEAGYNRGERLTEFVILGRWWADTCGNTGMMAPERQTPVPADYFAGLPDVLTSEEFWEYVQANYPHPNKFHTSVVHMGGDRATAQPGIPCAACGRGWELADAHDCMSFDSHVTEPLADFVGRPLEDFKATLALRTDAKYRVQLESCIRNDRHINLNSDPRFPTLKINEFGWIGRSGEVGPDYIVQEGDEVSLIKWTYFHPNCHTAVLEAQRRGEFTMLFRLSGYPTPTCMITPIPNEYGEAEYGGSWFVISTPVGKIKIGWRRRVINIDWSDTGQDQLHLFEDVTDTKSESYIHAWSYEQALDYLTRLRKELLPDPVAIG